MVGPLQFTEIKYAPSFVKAQQRLKEIWVVKQQPQEHSQKSHQTCHEFFCIFEDYVSGTQNTEVTKSLQLQWLPPCCDYSALINFRQ